MIRPDLFEAAQAHPESINADESLVLGLASMSVALDGEGSEEVRQQMLVGGMGLVTSSLRRIRTDPQYSERQRFVLVGQVLTSVDFGKNSSQLPQTAETVELFAETMLTLARGLETAIHERIGEHFDGMVRGFYQASAIMLLGDKAEDLTPVGQIKYLENAETHTPEQRREIAVVWGAHLAPTATDRQAADMLDYFIDQGDMKAVYEITAAVIKAGNYILLGEESLALPPTQDSTNPNS